MQNANLQISLLQWNSPASARVRDGHGQGCGLAIEYDNSTHRPVSGPDYPAAHFDTHPAGRYIGVEYVDFCAVAQPYGDIF